MPVKSILSLAYSFNGLLTDEIALLSDGDL